MHRSLFKIEHLVQNMLVFSSPGQFVKLMSVTRKKLVRNPRATLILWTLVVSLLLVGTCSARQSQQSSDNKEGPLPRDLEETIVQKQELIQRETTGLSGNEWAGKYFEQDDLTAGTEFSWAPGAGFVIRWSTCSHGWRERANYGTAVFENGVLKLSPVLSGNRPIVLTSATQYFPILWDKRHYLIPTDQIVKYCYAAKNANNPDEISAFLLRDGDESKPRKGFPLVPRPFRTYLVSKPITALVINIKTGPDAWYQELKLNVGAQDGVVKGMKFYAFGLANVYMLVEVLSVNEHDSVSYIVTSGFKNNSTGSVEPRVGWKLTSRAPKGMRLFLG